MIALSPAQFSIREAKTHLSRIVERAGHGEEIVISRDGTPVAKIVPLTREVSGRGRGSMRGKLVTAQDWDSAEVNADIADDFGLEP